MFLNIFIKFIIITLLLIITIFNNCKLLNASVTPHFYCHKDLILVELHLSSNQTNGFHSTIYWENLHKNSPKNCQTFYRDQKINFKVNLKDYFKCGFERSVNKQKHQASFSQNLIIEENHNATSKINIKCLYKFKTYSSNFKHKLVKRETFPEDFQEQKDIEPLETIEQLAPEPEVLMEVRQNNELISGNVTVIPGTPLIMEIKLNEVANEIYGLNVKFLQVSDMAEMSETILYKGCTVDPYLFENFNITETNSLKSKFRAFKFPNTAFVQFRANVQICLNKCINPQCIGGGNSKQKRRRRAANEHNDVYEVSSSFVLKFNGTLKGNEAEFVELQKHVNLLANKSQQLIVT